MKSDVITRHVKTEDAVAITRGEHADFLYEYEKAVLIALKERHVLTDGQLMQCLERLFPVGENG